MLNPFIFSNCLSPDFFSRFGRPWLSFDAEAAGEGFFSKLLSKLSNFAMTSGLRLIAAALVLVVGFALAKKLFKAYTSSRMFSRVPRDIQGILRWLINFILRLVVIILAIAILGIPLTSAATILSSCTLALGLALQGSLSNLAGGLMLLIFKPFHVGDYIEASGFSGTVESIGVFYTALQTPDNRRIVMPNSALSNTNVVNFSVYDTRRVDITVSAGASADSEAVKALVRGVIAGEALALAEPEPFVRLNDCTDGKLNYTVRVWCRQEDYFTLYNDLQEHLRLAFAEKGVSPALNTIKIEK